VHVGNPKYLMNEPLGFILSEDAAAAGAID